MKTTDKPTLLEMFQRFTALFTPLSDSITDVDRINLIAERQRLARDIPEEIRRLQAFADANTDAIMGQLARRSETQSSAVAGPASFRPFDPESDVLIPDFGHIVVLRFSYGPPILGGRAMIEEGRWLMCRIDGDPWWNGEFWDGDLLINEPCQPIAWAPLPDPRAPIDAGQTSTPAAGAASTLAKLLENRVATLISDLSASHTDPLTVALGLEIETWAQLAAECDRLSPIDAGQTAPPAQASRAAKLTQTIALSCISSGTQYWVARDHANQPRYICLASHDELVKFDSMDAARAFTKTFRPALTHVHPERWQFWEYTAPDIRLLSSEE